MPLRFAFAPISKAALMLTSVFALSACANVAGSGLFPTFSGSDATSQASIESQPVDPLNADPMSVDPLSADPMSASASSGSGSQLVPLGTLTATDMPAQPSQRRSGPAPLIPPSSSQAAAPVPMPAPVNTPPASVAPVLTPPPSMTAQAQQVPQPAPTPTPAQTMPPASAGEFMPQAVAPMPETMAAATVMATPTGPSLNSAREYIPQPDAREFIPAQIAATEPMTSGATAAPKISVSDSNLIRRFQVLSRLRDEGLITQQEHDARRAANVGALLQYSKEPPGLGLDRPVPTPSAISARLQALGRSLEMRAITIRQHEMERSTILNSLLPERPDPRAPKTPPPSDMFALADAAGRLAYIRDENLISEAEFQAEKAAMDRVMRGGEGIVKTAVASNGKASTGTANAAASAPAAPPPPDTLDGPVLHLASFRSAEGARSGFEQAKAKNPQLFDTLRFEARKTNLGEQGTFYRLLVGPFASLGDAELACVEMKKVDQFCRPTADGS